MKYFHSYEYRHLLRSAAHYADFKGLKKSNDQWWDKKYSELKTKLIVAGLDPAGFSVEHTRIIDNHLGFKGKLINIYHNL